ncbi:MAG: aconitase X catalytic domain-containing protein [Rhodospirillaceae bacterium]|nr:aconitase X catalytic domain-containing protein [Rhodospirillaceae bacterium]
MHLTDAEAALLARSDATGLAARLVVDAAVMLGADRLVEIDSAHIDGCLYHGDSGVLFAEHLVALGGRVAVPATLNVGALDLIHADVVRTQGHRRAMALRQAKAYEALGCAATWTCAPYQVGHRPGFGRHVAWGESNAVAFANSVLGARTERYGDLLDICAALSGRAPHVGLHVTANRRARIAIDLAEVPARLLAEDTAWPVLGAWIGAQVGDLVPVLVLPDGLGPWALPRSASPPGRPDQDTAVGGRAGEWAGTGLPTTEDRLKALGAAMASTGAVGLFHVVGVTPEAPDLATATQGQPPEATLRPSLGELRQARDRLGAAAGDGVDAVAIGSPHLSQAQADLLVAALAGRSVSLPLYACTNRRVLEHLATTGADRALAAQGVTLVVDTCVVVTHVLPQSAGVLMTDSAKFAHYALPNAGYRAVYGSLADCVETAVAGRLTRDESIWR